MLNTTIKLLKEKWRILFISFLLIVGLCSQEAFSQEVIHSYKITGEKRTPYYSEGTKEIAVEYDPSRSDHVIISNYGSNGVLLKKAQYLFIENRFIPLDFQFYLNTKKLFLDGISTTYAEDQSIVNESIYTMGVLRKQTTF